jgi:hypothetical protein
MKGCSGVQSGRISGLSSSDITIVPNLANFTNYDYTYEIRGSASSYGWLGPKPKNLYRASAYFGINSKILYSNIDSSFGFVAITQISGNSAIYVTHFIKN